MISFFKEINMGRNNYHCGRGVVEQVVYHSVVWNVWEGVANNNASLSGAQAMEARLYWEML